VYSKSVLLSGIVAPTQIAVDAAGTLYFGSLGTLYRATGSGTSYTESFFYPFTSANNPYDAATIAIDAAGNLYVAGSASTEGTKVVRAPSFPSTAVATATVIPVIFSTDSAGSVTFSTSFAGTQAAGGLDFALGSGSTCTGTVAASTSCTANVVFTPTTPGQRLGAVTTVNGTGNVLDTAFISGTGTGPLAEYPGNSSMLLVSGIQQPTGFAIDAAGNLYWSNNIAGGNVYKRAPGGTVTTFPQFYGPIALTVDGAGTLYYVSSGDVGLNFINGVAAGATTPTLNISYTATGQIQGSNVAVDKAGNLYVPETDGVTVLTAANNYAATTLASTLTISALALNAAGYIYAVTTDNASLSPNSLFEITPSGTATLLASTGISTADGIAVDPAGNIYVGNNGNNTVVRFAAGSYTQSTVTSALKPAALAFDGSGNLYVADQFSSGIVEIARGSAPGLAYGNTAVSTSSAAQTVTLENDGNAALTISGLVSPSTSFTLDSTCSTETALAFGTTCTVGAMFTPQTARSLTSAIVITDNSNNAIGAIQIVPLSGMGTSGTPTVTVSNVTVAYGTASATLSATVSSGSGIAPTGALTFTVAGGSSVIATCTAGACSETCTASYSTSTLTPTARTITASVAADANYNVSSGTGSLTVTPITPAIAFAVSGHTYGDAPFTVSATSNSTGAFTYAAVSGPATIAGNTVTLTGVGLVALRASEAADTDYTASSQQASFNVAQAQLTVTTNNATRYYGAANPAFTGSVTGAKYSDTFTPSFTTTATTTSPVNTYAIVPSVAGATLGDYSVTENNGTLTITQVPITTGLTVSSTSVNPNQSVTLIAATASTTSGTPTGSVTFWDNGTALQTVPLASGRASYTTTLSPASAHSLTASYSGDTNFLPSASPATSAVVSVGQLTFSLNGSGSAALTVAPGSVASYSFMLSPNFGLYPGPVSFSVTGLPPGATATFSPATLAANGGTQAVTLSIQTSAALARNDNRTPWSHDRAPLLALLVLPLVFGRRVWSKLNGPLLAVVLLLGGLAGVAGVTGCGTGTSGCMLQRPQTYNLTVTVSSGSLQQSQIVTLTVQ
jgi:hypothetical protein